MEHEESKEEEDSEESAMEERKSSYSMEPQHEEVKAREDSDAQEYGEAGITSVSWRAQKQGTLTACRRWVTPNIGR